MKTTPDLEALVDELLQARKYRGLNLPRETVHDLLEREMAHARTPKDALQAVRQKLHNLVAPYLGDPDYGAAAAALDAAFEAGPAAVKTACIDLLSAHASTRERIPILEDFYTGLFAVTGRPEEVLDLACGLNPFAWPWMGLPADTRYHACDLHGPRVALINHYFSLQGLAPLAEAGDILVNPPQIEAPVAFFFKEAHRFEQRRRGACREFIQALRVRWLLVSLPSENLTHQHSLVERHRHLVEEMLDGLPYKVTERIFPGEMVFCIDRHG